jgi:hypothetical protein
VKVSLPSLDQELVVFEQFTQQGLGKVIGLLVVCVTLMHIEFILVRPKPMPLVEKVAGAIGDAIVGRKIIGTLVVLTEGGRSRQLTASRRRRLIGSKALSEYNRAVYSASKVEHAMELCNCDFQISGNPLNKITYPVREQAESDSK